MLKQIQRLVALIFQNHSARTGIALCLTLTVMIAGVAQPILTHASTMYYLVTNVNDSGPNSLRQAIIDSNANPGNDTILFDIPNEPIVLYSPLPTITSPVQICGCGASVILDGVNAGSYATGLTITAGNSTIQGLTIVRFSNHGIWLHGGSGNVIRGNQIGSDGWLRIPNTVGNAWIGLLIDGSGNNLIGGTNPSDANFISGNGQSGIYITRPGATGNVIQGNFIGVIKSIGYILPLGNHDQGILIDNQPRNTIGGTTPAERNVISGNGQNGIYIVGSGASGNTVSGNYVGHIGAIGYDIESLPEFWESYRNGLDGIRINNAPNNTIGGTVSGSANFISANLGNGILLMNSGAVSNRILGNYIGTDRTGKLAASNYLDGVRISNASKNTIGGVGSGSRNVISGNSGSGINVTGTSSTGNLLASNYIGVDVTGLQELGNGQHGVTISGASDNTIGNPGAGNVISGNLRRGISLVDYATRNTIQANYIGTNASGVAKLGNHSTAIYMNSTSNNVIGNPGAGNVISGNTGAGLFMVGPTTGNAIQANYIGTDASGSAPLGNLGAGIYIASITGSATNKIGGVGAGNIISDNGDGGVYLDTNANNTLVQSNYIGTNKAGSLALGNHSNGVYVRNAANTTISGDNVISGNTGNGVLITGNTPGSVITGNRIGVSAVNSTLLGNQGAGIRIANASRVNVGDGVNGNLISGNKKGIVVTGTSVFNAFTANSIYGNLLIDIDLNDDYLTVNDINDGDTGPNNLQNYPVIQSVTGSGTLTVTLKLNSTPNTSYALQLFASANCGISGNGGGQTFLNSAFGVTDSNGNISFTINVTPPTDQGFITATAINLLNNDTSEFSNCMKSSSSVVQPAPNAVPTFIP